MNNFESRMLTLDYIKYIDEYYRYYDMTWTSRIQRNVNIHAIFHPLELQKLNKIMLLLMIEG